MVLAVVCTGAFGATSSENSLMPRTEVGSRHGADRWLRRKSQSAARMDEHVMTTPWTGTATSNVDGIDIDVDIRCAVEQVARMQRAVSLHK
jgi:hypothetical protein